MKFLKFIIPTIVLSLTLLFGFSEKAYAYSSDEEAINSAVQFAEDRNYQYYFIADQGGFYYLWIGNSPVYVKQLNPDFMLGSAGTAYLYYAYSSDTVWKSNGQYSSYWTAFNTRIVYSNYDIINQVDGTVFFSAPKPPQPLAQAVTELPGMITPTVKMITVVAVSCLALLVGSIILLPKLVRLFLV